MPELTVTETQNETLAEIQADLEAAYIDSYGHIRLTDVVQYLLDTYTPPEAEAGDTARERIATAEFQALQTVAADVDGVPGSGIDTETMRGELLSTLGVEEFAARLAALDDADAVGEAGADGASEDADAVTADSSESSTADQSTAAETPAEGDAGADGDADEDSTMENESTEAAGDGAAETKTSSGPPSGPGSVLSAANKLLTDHDDKWRKGGSDEPYEVDLPDGTTEKVRTKDDIRGLLFKHY